MPLLYLLDEQLRGPLWRTLLWHNAAGRNPVDVVRVGDFDDLPLGATDPVVLAWAEAAGRILVSFDRQTMAQHLDDHLEAGHSSPGIFLIRPQSTLVAVLSFLIDAAYASEPHEWQDRITFIP